MHYRFFSRLVLLIFGVSLMSCYERNEACLDTLATNFDITTDVECEECCTYPNFKLQVRHFLDGKTYGRDSIISTDSGRQLKLQNAILFLSNFTLHTAEGENLEVIDKGLYENEEGQEVELTEDIIVIQEESRLSTVGMVREIGGIDSISCDFGVKHNSVALENSSSIFTYDSLYLENKYVDMKLYIMYGDSFENNIQVSLISDDMNFLVQDTVIYKEKEPREDFSLTMNIDYFEVLKSLQFDNGTDELIIEDFQVPENLVNFNR